MREQKLKEFWEQNPAAFPELTEQQMMDEAALAISIKTREPLNQDILDPSKYSIQQDKLKSEEDRRRELAEKKKDGVRDQIKDLRNEFMKVREKNVKAEAHLQITDDDF